MRWSALLLLLAAADLGAHLYLRRPAWVRGVSKALLVPLVLAYYLLEARPVDGWIVAALLAAMSGDVLLLDPQNPRRFLPGLGAFLLGHLLWAVAFLRSTGFLAHVPPLFWLAALPYAGASVAFLLALRKDVRGRESPLALYAAIISLMSLLALARAFTASGAAFWLPFAGSLLFIASDAMLAFQVFHAQRKHGDLRVMAAYLVAQVLLVLGMLS